ncbi:MAG TPA: hypothetical protein VFT98_16350 [Myxococcota bacterium]|nr:hypothetical protein [Myxococcota bacterium]
MIELALTYLIGGLICGSLVTTWIWRSIWPHPSLAALRREV